MIRGHRHAFFDIGDGSSNAQGTDDRPSAQRACARHGLEKGPSLVGEAAFVRNGRVRRNVCFVSRNRSARTFTVAT